MTWIHGLIIFLHEACPSLVPRAFKVFCLKVAGAPSGRAIDRGFRLMRSTNLLTVVAACASAACADPVHDDAVDKLGGEVAGVEPGPLHRPGQPCVLCHSERGGESEFSLAGTVYVDALSLRPIEDVDVYVIDSQNRKFQARTNCAGNFYVKPEQFAPDFPIWIGIQRAAIFRDMDTAVYREGSCAGCHSDPEGLSSAGHVFLIENPMEEPLVPPSRCP